MSNLYKIGERDLIELGQSYTKHVSHMTKEGLHGKSDIAAELAYRDYLLEWARPYILSSSYDCQKIIRRIDKVLNDED